MVQSKKCILIITLLIFIYGIQATKSDWADCTPNDSHNHGKFDPVTNHTQTWNDTIFYSYYPSRTDQTNQKFPLLVYMHGSTGEWWMYNENLKMYSSHGMIVVFPFIKSPQQDKHFWVTNTDGTYLIKAIEYAKAMNEDPSHPFYGLIDIQNVVVAGHSMGATCSIKASQRLPQGSVKLTVTQHPGVCGPFGPPPLPATWMPSDMKDIIQKNPILMTTATNDGAFWPSPYTAEHEWGCFNKSKQISQNGAIFVQFSEAACIEDHDRNPYPDGGHNCPMKFKNGGGPETPWVLTAIKLYAQHDGNTNSKCFELLWGNSDDSLRNSKSIDNVDIQRGKNDMLFLQ